MSDKPPPEDLIELPLSHKETWDSVDKGGGGAPGRAPSEDPAERPRPPRPGGPSRSGRSSRSGGPVRERRPGAAAHSRSTRRSSRPGSWAGSWIVWLALAALAGLAYWMFWPSAPQVAFSASPLTFAEQRAGRSSEPLAVTLTNAGERVLRIDSIGVTRAELVEFETEAEDCSRVELAQGDECRVSLVFSPKAVGARSGELVVTGNMRGKRVSLPLAGEAVAPRLAARPPVLDFGSEAVGATSAGRELELVNEGTAPLRIERVSLDSGDGEFRLIGNECSSTTLAPGETCGLRMVFRPALFGRRSAELAVASDTFGDAAPIGLEGRGSGPDLEIRPEGLRFGNQLVGTRSEPETLTLINKGDEPYRINRAWIEQGSGFVVERENCSGASIAPGKECRVTVVFAPGGEGEVKSSLQIRESSGGMAPGIGISGTGVAPRLELSASTLGFGALPVGERSAARSLRITNSGSAPVSIARLSLAGSDAASFSRGRDGCSEKRLVPGQSCEIAFEFGPRHSGGHEAALVVSSDQKGAAPKVQLTGHGQAPELSLDRRRLDFAAVRQTESQDLRVEVSNSGDAPLRIGAVRIGGTAAKDFELAGNACSQATLPPGGTCQVAVRFAPQTDGPRDARLILESNAGGEPVELVIRGAGLAPPAAGIEVAPRSVDLGAWSVGDRSEVVTISVSSTGAGRLELTGFRITGPNAGDFRVVAGTCQGLQYVAPQGDCTFGVRFTAGASGERTATLVIEHNAPTGPVRLALRAAGH